MHNEFCLYLGDGSIIFQHSVLIRVTRGVVLRVFLTFKPWNRTKNSPDALPAALRCWLKSLPVLHCHAGWGTISRHGFRTDLWESMPSMVCPFLPPSTWLDLNTARTRPISKAAYKTPAVLSTSRKEKLFFISTDSRENTFQPATFQCGVMSITDRLKKRSQE